MEKSLQKIVDFYINRGYKDEKLRNILKSDKAYIKLLNERKQKLSKKFHLTKSEERKHVMSADQDYEILGKIKILEKMKLKKEEKFLVNFARTQLEHDWRKPLMKMLNKVLQNHRSR